LYITAALVMIILEYFVLLRLYKRSKNLQIVSIFVAPLMIVVGLWLTLFIQKQLNITPGRINPIVSFIVFIGLELPIAIYGYDLTPNAPILERCIVAGVFGTTAIMIASSIVNNYF